MQTVVLSVEAIAKSFGGVKAVRDVSFALDGGKVLGLIGPNGAGKTTIFNIVNGIFRADAGAVILGNTDITAFRPADIARLGLARTFQVPRIFGDMTVADNLRVPLTLLGLSRHEMERRVAATLSSVRLDAWELRFAKELAGGQKKLLELARAVIEPPKALLLDEPFSGASSDVIDLTLDIVADLSARGTACLVISHDIVSMPRLCEDVVVLVGGSVLTKGRLEDVRRDPAVIEAYLGN